MAEQSHITTKTVIDVDADRQTKPLSSPTREPSASVEVPDIDAVKNTDIVSNTAGTEGRSVAPSSRENTNQISNESEISSNVRYQAVVRDSNTEKKIDPTMQSNNSFAWNNNFVPPNQPNLPVHQHPQSITGNGGLMPNEMATRNSSQRGRIFVPGHYPNVGHQAHHQSAPNATLVPPNFHNMPVAHPHAMSMAAMQQHHAAASAAEHHLQWRMHAHQGDTKNENNSGILMNRSQMPDLQRDQLLEKCTAEIARRLSGTGNASSSERDFSGIGSVVNATNERKRSFSEVEYTGSNSSVQQPHPSENRPSNSLSSTQAHHPSLGSTFPGSTISSKEQDISDTMDKALDEATENDATRTSKTSSTGRRVDTPMTYLVRQLLGQVEVYGNEPAVVLAPNLVKEASLKIRAVINKLMEKVAEDAKRDSQVKIREAEAKSTALEESHAAQNMKTAANLAVLDYFTNVQQRKDFDELKTFAEQQVKKVLDHESLIKNLRSQLRTSQASVISLQEEVSAFKRQRRTPSEKHSNATIRNLISQLDDGMTKLQHQKKEIDVLKAVIQKDAESLKGCHDMREFLMHAFGLCDPKAIPQHLLPPIERGTSAALAANQNELTFLRKQVEDLKAGLKLEHERGESTLRAYMRAAVHALKTQNRGLDE